MKFHEFLEFTPIEFNRLLEIKGDKETQAWRKDMERMRLQTFALVNSQRTKKDQIKLKALMPFEWDHEQVTQLDPQPTEEEFKRMDNISAGGNRNG